MKIAVFLGGLKHDSQQKIVKGIWNRARLNGDTVYLFVCDSGEDRAYNDGEFEIFRLPDIAHYDGIIFHADTIYDEQTKEYLMEEIQRRNIPCVSLNCGFPGAKQIDIENKRPIEEIVHHLVETKGARIINYVGGDADARDSQNRLLAFLDTTDLLGIKVEKQRIFVGEFSAQTGREAVDYYKSRGLLKADAYICANDEIALSLLYRLEENGIRVPGDTMVTGFDNILMASSHFPRITSVQRHETEVGEKAFDTLKSIMAGEAVEDYHLAHCEVVYGGSTRDEENAQALELLQEVQKNYISKTIKEDALATLLSGAAAAYTVVDDLNGFKEVAKRYIKELQAQEFYLCLNSDTSVFMVEDKEVSPEYTEAAPIEEYSDEMRVEIAYRDYQFLRESVIHKGEVIPDVSDDDRKGNLYIIKPLHFQRRNFGYCVICNSSLPMESEYYHMLILDMCNALENIRGKIQRQKMVQVLNKRWIYDHLTKVYNRSGFFHYAKELVTRAREKKEDLFFVFLDLDNLKKINDEYGHDAGDTMICAMAEVLNSVLEMDELLMRYGGDEFVILGSGYNRAQAESYVARIREAIDRYNVWEEHWIKLSASIGYHLVDSRVDTPLNTLIEMADQAMYQEKRLKHKGGITYEKRASETNQ